MALVSPQIYSRMCSAIVVTMPFRRRAGSGMEC